MNPLGLVCVFTPTIMIYFGLPPPDRSSLYPLALVVIVFPALAPKGQQRHDNQKSIYHSHHLGPTGEDIRHTDVLRLPP
jgi:hypothetical protein